jgi:hypothetical protein
MLNYIAVYRLNIYIQAYKQATPLAPNIDRSLAPRYARRMMQSCSNLWIHHARSTRLMVWMINVSSCALWHIQNGVSGPQGTDVKKGTVSTTPKTGVSYTGPVLG